MELLKTHKNEAGYEELVAEKDDLEAGLDEEEEMITCRICLDDCERHEVISPCACRGGSKWVHRDCLDRWRTMREDRAFSKCTECLSEYKLISICDDTEEVKNARLRSYWFHVIRDIVLAVLVAILIITLLAYITYLCDHKHSILIHEFHMRSYPVLFYTLCGFCFAMAAIGLFSLCALCSQGGTRSHDPVCYPYYYYGAGSDAELCCCCRCVPSSAAEGGTGCGSCGAADGCACGSIECGEMGPFVLVIMGILIVIGLIASVVAGMIFAQKILQQHMHLIHKQGLAAQFIVADLDSPDGDYGMKVYRNAQQAKDKQYEGYDNGMEKKEDMGIDAADSSGHSMMTGTTNVLNSNTLSLQRPEAIVSNTDNHSDSYQRRNLHRNPGNSSTEIHYHTQSAASGHFSPITSRQREELTRMGLIETNEENETLEMVER